MTLRYFTFLLAIPLLLMGCAVEESTVRDFRADFISNMDNAPIFSWKYGSMDRAFHQSAYQIVVDGIWDSGKLEGASSLQHKYAGPVLKAGEQYFAKVRVWDQDGQAGGWSEEIRFVAPLVYPDNWQAQWLTFEYEEGDPLPLFRKSFEVEDLESIDYARFYITAPGYYEASLNGEKIGDILLDPGQSNYEDYTYYTAYDVDPAELLKENVLGVMLGNGWYNQYQVWRAEAEHIPMMVYGQPVFICQLEIHRKDGSKEVVSSDLSWEWTPGPIRYSNAYGGEHYDARREVAGWDEPGEVKAQWNAAISPEIHPTMLYEQFAEPIREMKEVHPVSIDENEDGSYMFDFGQNLTGWMELRIEGDEGQEILIKCAEVLRDGKLDTFTTGFRATRVVQTQKYICKGGGVEVWRPRFNYHGYRYAQVSGLKKAPTKELLTSKVLYSSFEDVGTFTCSEENLNRMHELALWTIIGNSQSVLSDCPHREKCGWTGDAHADSRSLLFNYDGQRFFEKYCFDMRSSGREEKVELYFAESFSHRSMRVKPAGITTMIAPGKRTSGMASPDWGTAICQVPWYLYLYSGDRAILEEFYTDMKTWVEYIDTVKKDGIIPHGLGDWCPPGGNANKDCPVPVSSSAFHILDTEILAKTAALTGRKEDQAKYEASVVQLKADFNRHFFDPETNSYGNAQTSNIMALDVGIVPEGKEKAVCEAILRNMNEEYDGFVNTGIFGIARVFKVLSENGFEKEVYRILSKKGDNSFANMWDSWDATTLWESLPTRDEFARGYRGSMNHPMQSGFDEWFYSGIAGINPTEEGPGFTHIKFKPYLTRQMESASASYDSKAGLIKSAWENSDDRFRWEIEIPANAKGLICIPVYDEAAGVTVNGEEISGELQEDGFILAGEYSSGKHTINVDH